MGLAKEKVKPRNVTIIASFTKKEREGGREREGREERERERNGKTFHKYGSIHEVGSPLSKRKKNP